ncbi:hypothetical protein QZM62_12720 [Burkholderia multivorans]|nr:hypothetical protein [Burkholderia multivorans]
MASILPNGKTQFIDANGRPLVYGKVYYYEPKTETFKDTFTDSSGTTPNTNPVVLDGRGQASIWGSGAYRQLVKDRSGLTIWDEEVSDLTGDLAGAEGASLVGFAQDLNGATTRTIQKKAAEIVSVTDWPGDPMDHTAMFSAAAQNAPGIDNVRPPYDTIPHPITAYVRVPAGNYTITSLVDTGGRDVTWLLDPAANVTGIDFLNGTVVRDGYRKTRMFPLGTMDQATAGCFSIGTTTTDKTAPVLGVMSTQQMADYTQRDAVGLVAAAYSYPFLINAATATYTATTANIPAQSADVVKRLRPGMVIYTGHATRCCGILQSWSADGSTLVVPEWRAKGGSGPVTPDNTAGLTIGSDKLWAMNGVVELNATGSATQAIGQELSVRNGLAASSTDIDDTTNRVWGYLAGAPTSGTPGYYRAQAAYMARGYWAYGYVSQEQDIGFYYRSTTAKVGYQYYGTGYGVQFINPTNGYLSLRLNYNGNIELGTREVATAAGRFINFNTSGNGSASGDSQIVAMGGTATPLTGTLSLISSATTFSGNINPTNDNVRSCGTASNRWSVIYAGTGTINTSDARLKSAVRMLSAAEIAAAQALAAEIGAYQFLARITEKGANGARLHIGLTVQRAIEIMQAHGLDPMAYGFICYDKWDAVDELLDEHGTVIVPAREAGDLYSFRDNELHFFMLAGLLAAQAAQADRIAALEAKAA